ncbi:bifunctional helix-turn-helix transcriptional regulator/GNAT family N-acetyltransferase [Hymenobacter sp. RP-2-7]|uniref:Bifunctional helix-turn-helix transcriptional regulator/GNAT family N-acetyltransferase n=1 Tax=Hymenobacter polaris TaxID=2682546 RepID=A0A7Y0AC08_9BACT|nr:bifunctional helix-turn-helix transcriptional regulator/GNAT family N-acetyltransferase [Hymenobacter polaris]NML64584.1 bifunctional helix-turn-helix transcriptional regulator/GNAT family N-acetyltransferase [Hymenobacter polaris]
MDFIHQLGPVALGSRLRRISEQLTAEASLIYADYNLAFQPRWYPVFYLVAQQPGLTANEIAERLGHTHAAVSQVVKELVKSELLAAEPSASDQRRRLLHLTARGQTLLPQLQAQTADVRHGIEDLLATAAPHLWSALEALEQHLHQQPLHQRVAAARQRRVSSGEYIRDYTAADQPIFRQLNVEWITRYFALEPADLKALDQPQDYILAPGGCILLAESAGQVVGACALIKLRDEPGYELAKMAVSPAAQGQGLGYRLGQAAVQRARELGATRLYLESNSVLTPALRLYRKLGFRPVANPPASPYARADVFMELFLT